MSLLSRDSTIGFILRKKSLNSLPWPQSAILPSSLSSTHAPLPYHTPAALTSPLTFLTNQFHPHSGPIDPALSALYLLQPTPYSGLNSDIASSGGLEDHRRHHPASTLLYSLVPFCLIIVSPQLLLVSETI